MKVSRREWMKGTTLVTLGAASSTALGIQPLPRSLPPAFQYSLAAYSYRALLSGKAPSMTTFDFIDDCARFGLEGTELTSYYFEDPCTDDYLRRLKRHCFRLGIDISGTAIRCDFGVPPGEQRNQEIAAVKKWIERAEVLGAPVIRIFAGHRAKSHSDTESHALMVEGIQTCCEYAGQHGVHLALENHGGPTATADGLLRIVRDVESEWFGVNLDTGNFHSKDVYAEIRRAAPYALNVQVKVVVSGPDKKKVPTDMRRVASILRETKYRGYVVLEYEEGGDPRAESERYLDELRRACSEE